MSCQLKDFLLRDSNSIVVVQAAHINILKGVVIVVNLIKYLPGYIELDSLPHNLKLIPVLLLIEVIEIEILSHRLVDFVVEFVLCFLHFLVKNLVIFCPNFMVSLEFFFRRKRADV